MDLPVVFQYQKAFDEFRRGGGPAPLLKRMSELISLLDLTTTLSSRLSTDDILDAALLIVLGELQTGRGCLFVRDEEGAYRLRASRGLSGGAPSLLAASGLALESVVLRESGELRETFDALGLEALCPVLKAGQAIAVLGIGSRADGARFGPEDTGFLRSVAACAATPIENGLVYNELRRVNQRLSVKVFQLNSLFDISRELTASFDEESIKQLVTTTLMGHLMVSRCVVYLEVPEGLALAHERGLKTQETSAVIPAEHSASILGELRATKPVQDLPPGPLRDRLERSRMVLVVPLSGRDRARGFMAVGARPSGAPFSEEDCDFAQTLGRQALAALETVRLHRIRLENERRAREMQIARQIQQSLFPSGRPDVPGFELAAQSDPCHEVGGDYYDFIPLHEGRLALAVADVSGKGTPASILMASVHASLRALAGTTAPDVLMDRLNRFLLESTQANRYVTLFYGELDPRSRQLRYVNAGHVPPYQVGRAGRRRLEKGGPVLGLLDEARFEVGEVILDPGDVLAVVTDGVSEAASPEEVEFGDDHVFEALERGVSGTATDALRSVVDAVHAWVSVMGCADDLTALVLKARES